MESVELEGRRSKGLIASRYNGSGFVGFSSIGLQEYVIKCIILGKPRIDRTLSSDSKGKMRLACDQ